jgi:hypothetical protein
VLNSGKGRRRPGLFLNETVCLIISDAARLGRCARIRIDVANMQPLNGLDDKVST